MGDIPEKLSDGLSYLRRSIEINNDLVVFDVIAVEVDPHLIFILEIRR